MESSLDLVIIGGGPAGIGAGVAAISQGFRTLIVHSDREIGGQATNVYVGTICGVHRRHDKEDDLVGNFPRGFTRSLATLSNTSIVSNNTGLSYLPYKIEAFKELSTDLLNNNLLQIKNESRVTKVNTVASAILSIEIQSKDKIETIKASTFIDCSGEGILTVLGSGEMIEENDYQQGALVVGVSGIKEKDEEILKLSLFKELESAYRNKLLCVTGKSLNFVPKTTNTYKDVIYFKFNSLTPESTYEEEVTKVCEVVRYLNTQTSFSGIEIAYLSSTLGVRSSRRPKGIKVLTDSMVLGAEKSKLSIAKGIWPVELWKGPKAPIIEYIRDDDYYDIPYDCLVSKSFKNLLSAGSAISSEEKAHSSARVIGTCLQTGHAAGFLASKISIGKNLEEAALEYQKSEGLT